MLLLCWGCVLLLFEPPDAAARDEKKSVRQRPPPDRRRCVVVVVVVDEGEGAAPMYDLTRQVRRGSRRGGGEAARAWGNEARRPSFLGGRRFDVWREAERQNREWRCQWQ